MVIDKDDRLILVTNDDGISARGLKMLFDIMHDYGKVVMISTKDIMSSKSMAITVNVPIRAKLIEETDRHRIYETNGTPTDCAKLSINSLLERTPDLVVSGINQGANSSVCVLYSGTMGAVIEGCLYGIDSIGFSLCSFSSRADYSVCESVIRKTTQYVIDNRLPKYTCLNVNVPAIKPEELKGIKACRQALGNWTEEFDKRVDPHGKTYYWMTGTFCNHEPESEDTDEWALANGYASVVPTTIDMTDFKNFNDIKRSFH